MPCSDLSDRVFVLLFDSGLGGLTVLRALRHAVPEAAICYVADDARFPYSALGDEELATGLCELLAEPVRSFAPDAIVIACNTAATVSLPIDGEPDKASYSLGPL